MKSAFHIWVFLIHSSRKKVLLFFSNDFLSKKIHQWKNHTFKMRTAAAFHTDKEWKNSDMTFWNFCGLDRYSPLCMQANYQLISSTAPHLSKGRNEAFVNVPLRFLNLEGAFLFLQTRDAVYLFKWCANQSINHQATIPLISLCES